MIYNYLEFCLSNLNTYRFYEIWPIKKAQARIQVQRILEEKGEMQEYKVIMKP